MYLHYLKKYHTVSRLICNSKICYSKTTIFVFKPPPLNSKELFYKSWLHATSLPTPSNKLTFWLVVCFHGNWLNKMATRCMLRNLIGSYKKVGWVSTFIRFWGLSIRQFLCPPTLYNMLHATNATIVVYYVDSITWYDTQFPDRKHNLQN